jgi:hypothetical protein
MWERSALDRGHELRISLIILYDKLAKSAIFGKNIGIMTIGFAEAKLLC